MPPIFVQFGKCHNCRLDEVPTEVIEQLGKRYPLDATRYDIRAGNLLLTVIAIHQELARRRDGGEISPSSLSSREIVASIINKGFDQVSREKPPDSTKETQRRINQAREQLQLYAKTLEFELRDGDIIITSKKVKRWSHKPALEHGEFYYDEDVPF